MSSLTKILEKPDSLQHIRDIYQKQQGLNFQVITPLNFDQFGLTMRPEHGLNFVLINREPWADSMHCRSGLKRRVLI
jgi:hypothetical protein